jgi:hypothetical protein
MRLTSGEKFKYRPYEGAAFRYKEAQCIKVCEDPDSDICKLCEIKEKKNMNTGKITVHGRMGGPIPNGSHIEGGPWNLADLERHARELAKAKEARVNAPPATRRRRRAVAAPARQRRRSVKAANKSSSGSSSSSSSGSSKSSSAKSSSAKSGSAKSSSAKSSSSKSGSSKSGSSKSSSSSGSSSSRHSRKQRKLYLPVSRAASASPPRRAPPVYEGWTTPLASSEKKSENVEVLKRIQEGLNANPKLAPDLE